VKRVWVVTVALCVAIAASAVAQDNVSAKRDFGFGVQWTGEAFGVSVRYWFSDAAAAEFDVLFLPGFVANIALRGLLKPRLPGWSFDTPQSDYYVGIGVGFLNIVDTTPSFYAQSFAGIETNSSHTQAWNMEFGVDYLAGFIAEDTEQLTAVTFGMGLHLYP